MSERRGLNNTSSPIPFRAPANPGVSGSSQQEKMAGMIADAMARRKPDIEFYGQIKDAVLNLIPSHNECAPGIRMVEYNVLVAMPEMPEETSGGVMLPSEVRDRMEMAMQCGRIISASPVAFNYDDFYQLYPKMAPKVGDLVWIARYAGGEAIGKDGRRYRLVKDKDVGGVIEPPTE